jgi:hypothetical protein
MFKIIKRFFTKIAIDPNNISGSQISGVRYNINKNIFKKIELSMTLLTEIDESAFNVKIKNGLIDYSLKEENVTSKDLIIIYFQDKDNTLALNNCDVELVLSQIDKLSLVLLNSKITLKVKSEINNINMDIRNSILNIDTLYVKHITISSDQNKIDISNLSCETVDLNLKDTNIKIVDLQSNRKITISSHGDNVMTLNSIIGDKVMVELEDSDKAAFVINDIHDNSLISITKYENVNIQFNPFLLMGVNLYLKKESQFFRVQFFDREGYSFCPTIILNSQEALPKGYSLYKYTIPIRLKIIGFILLGIVAFKIYTADDVVYRDLFELKVKREFLNMKLKNII